MRTDGHDEANSRFSKAPKKRQTLHNYTHTHTFSRHKYVQILKKAPSSWSSSQTKHVISPRLFTTAHSGLIHLVFTRREIVFCRSLLPVVSIETAPWRQNDITTSDKYWLCYWSCCLSLPKVKIKHSVTEVLVDKDELPVTHRHLSLGVSDWKALRASFLQVQVLDHTLIAALVIQPHYFQRSACQN
jgi:hypothetical protein